MSIVSDDLRKRAASDRAEAESTVLINKKAVLLASARKLDEFAGRAERTEFLSRGRSGG